MTKKARNWSRLDENADTVASAAITSCANQKSLAEPVLVYELRSEKLPAARIGEHLKGLEETLKQVAVTTVVEERAKRLPVKQPVR